jgi:RimJ/RimL family protein N-acetyltransferase
VRLATERLILRPFELSDAPAVQQLAGAREIAATTLLIPHPYPDGAAEEWISAQPQPGNHNFAVTLRESAELVGAVGLREQREHQRGEIGYWIGVPYWNRGYATEASIAVMEYGFGSLRLNRIFAFHFASNRSSGRVMEKAGMRHEGALRQHVMKWGEPLDIEVYGAIRADWVTPPTE